MSYSEKVIDVLKDGRARTTHEIVEAVGVPLGEDYDLIRSRVSGALGSMVRAGAVAATGDKVDGRDRWHYLPAVRSLKATEALIDTMTRQRSNLIADTVRLEKACTIAGREAQAQREENDRLTKRCSRLESAFVFAGTLATIELIALALALG